MDAPKSDLLFAPSFKAFALRSGKLSQVASSEVFARPSCASVGVFDGVHKGHRKVISALLSESGKRNAVSCVITFSRNPKDSFNLQNQFELMGAEEKMEAVLSLGADYVLVLDFNDRIKSMSGRDFISWLFARGVECLVAGMDFKCGNPSDYMAADDIAREFPGKIVIVDDVMCDNRKISSTFLRNMIRSKGGLSQEDRMKYLT